MDQAEAHSILESRYERLCASVVLAYQKYRKYPNRQIHRRTTRGRWVPLEPRRNPDRAREHHETRWPWVKA